jgi:bifunctional DNA primase/polymerase-like protein
MGAFELHAKDMLSNGYSPLPLYPNRHPTLDRWDQLRTTPLTTYDIDMIVGTSRFTVGLGVVGGYLNMVPVDVDVHDDEVEILEAVARVLPEPMVKRRGTKGYGTFCVSVTPIKARKFRRTGSGSPLVEILTTGMMVIPPTPHPKLGGKPYTWTTDATLFNTHVSELPEITQDHIDALEEVLAPWCAKRDRPSTKVVVDRETVNMPRMQAVARGRLTKVTTRFASLSQGRYTGIYAAAAALGVFVHHRVLPESEVRNAIMAAATSNGLVAIRGRSACGEWIDNGFAAAIRDQLPDLDALPGAKPRRPSYREQYEASWFAHASAGGY